jgi:thymidylate kinase
MSHSLQQLVKSVFLILNEDFNYAVLRGYEELPNQFSSHDIDILMTREEFERFKEPLLAVILEAGFKILMLNSDEQDKVMVLLARAEKSSLEHVCLDIFFDFSLYGNRYLDASGVLGRRTFNGQVFHVALEDEFLAKYLYMRLLGCEYPQKYGAVLQRVQAQCADSVDVHLSYIFGENLTIDIVDARSGLELRRLLSRCNAKRHLLRHLICRIKFMFSAVVGLINHKGITIGFSGPDGVGKTTVLERLISQLKEPVGRVELFHFRPTLVPRLAEVGRKCGVNKEVDCNYDNPHRGAKTGVVSSLIRLAYYIFDYNLGYLKLVKPTLFRRGVVIFDRYYTDVATDSKRSRIHLNYKWVFFLRRLVPRLDYNFLVVADPGAIRKRKQELTSDQIKEILAKIEYIAGAKHYTVIENIGTAEEAVSKILNHVLDKQHKKYIRVFR